MVVADPKDPDRIGILTFEMAAMMSRLVSIHRMVSDPDILILRSETMRSRGVAYLSSTDQSFLLRLACAELVEELDHIAEVVSRFCRRCRGPLPVGFDRIYTDLKTGSIDPHRLGLKIAGKAIDRRMKKLEKYVAAAAKLYKEMELLMELEATERKKWGRFSCPIATQKPGSSDSLRLEIKSLNSKVRRLKEDPLWNKPFDKAVELMALACYTVFARICTVFSPFVSGLPRIIISKENSRMFLVPSHVKLRRSTGPLERPSEAPIRNSCPIIRTNDSGLNVNIVNWSKVIVPPPNTVGGSGLALRYADIIVLAEKIMMDGDAETEREELYEMLPVGLQSAVRAKLREKWRQRGPLDGGLADGWKDAVWRILDWLGPVAHDTVQWEAERKVDRTQRFEPCPQKYMLQTLHFSDKVKTEAAIVEVLVGLSLVSWYDEQQRRGSYRH